MIFIKIWSNNIK